MATIEELTAEVAALRRRVDASEDILRLQALKARYSELLDRRYSGGSLVDQATLAAIADEVADLFTTDAIWDGGPQLGVATGRPAIASRLRTPTLAFACDLFVKPQIQVSGDRATARWICFVHAASWTVRPTGCAGTRMTPIYGPAIPGCNSR